MRSFATGACACAGPYFIVAAGTRRPPGRRAPCPVFFFGGSDKNGARAPGNGRSEESDVRLVVISLVAAR
jgi:hypothetical protein